MRGSVATVVRHSEGPATCLQQGSACAVRDTALPPVLRRRCSAALPYAPLPVTCLRRRTLRSEIQGDRGVRLAAPGRPGYGETMTAAWKRAPEPIAENAFHASLSFMIAEIAVERRSQLADSFSSCLRPRTVSE